MKLSSIKTRLIGCGYRDDLLRTDYNFSHNQRINPVVGFAQLPIDARSSCVAVFESSGDPKNEVEQCRPTGAPLVFVCAGNSLQWWRQGADGPHWIESVSEDRLDGFFEKRKVDFSPNAIYRAKTWGRFRSEFQLSFVDAGLMPLVEEEVGKALEQLIERNVTVSKSRLGWDTISDQQGHWLLKSVFWLVSAKILRDKDVPAFFDLDLLDVVNTFVRLGDHYGTPPIPIGSNLNLEVLSKVAEDIARFSNLSFTTTESLAHVYENTLISRATRSELGTHSTPTYLVDYIVGNLSDWIQEIPEEQRSVFEPACGHAAFLVSAMRLLTELLPESKATHGRRRQYLRKRIHGIDKDSFALELARLALTLTDMPNPDGWDLQAEDMFLTDDIEVQTKLSTILLANPPFEKFSETELQHYAAKNSLPVVNNKAVEMLRRTLSSMQPGSVFGFVMPQSMLHGKFAKNVRQLMLENFELREISLFADKVFSFADVESAVLIGRRLPAVSRSISSVRFQRIREWQIDDFKSSYRASEAKFVRQSRFLESPEFDLRIPDLEELWQFTSLNSKLGEVAGLGQGLFYFGATKLASESRTFSESEFEGSVKGFVRFEPDGIFLHELPRAYWMNLDVAVIERTVTGTTVGQKQILINYSRVSRGPWRLKALIDSKGHPVTSRFITLRSNRYSLETLWAILNSPVANAFAFAHAGKRDNLVGMLRKFPMPQGEEFSEIDDAVKHFFASANQGGDARSQLTLMSEISAAVLKRYNLPNELEYQLLSLFDGWERPGVSFKQSVLLPCELGGKVRYSDFVQYEKNWRTTNRRRAILIDKKIEGTLTEDERNEFEALQTYTDYYLEKETPLPTDELEKLENLLLRTSIK